MPKPLKGTPEYELWLAAIDIAAAAPLKRGTYVHAASIPWKLVNRLRDVLEELDIDWVSVCRMEHARHDTSIDHPVPGA